MLIYDVTYYLGEKRQAAFDRRVSEAYLSSIPRDLHPGETAFARCVNGGREHDREIDASGVRPAT